MGTRGAELFTNEVTLCLAWRAANSSRQSTTRVLYDFSARGQQRVVCAPPATIAQTPGKWRVERARTFDSHALREAARLRANTNMLAYDVRATAVYDSSTRPSLADFVNNPLIITAMRQLTSDLAISCGSSALHQLACLRGRLHPSGSRMVLRTKNLVSNQQAFDDAYGCWISALNDHVVLAKVSIFVNACDAVMREPDVLFTVALRALGLCLRDAEGWLCNL